MIVGGAVELIGESDKMEGVPIQLLMLSNQNKSANVKTKITKGSLETL